MTIAQRQERTRGLPRDVVLAARESRRHPSPTQFDYLHVRRLLADIETAIHRVGRGAVDVLDVFCGSRPYEDLLPSGSHRVGFDVDHRYGVADVVSEEFLPFADASFDLVLCTEAFHYVPDPDAGVAEFLRVLRPHGAAIVSVPFVWEYDRRILEHRFTGAELAALFAGWDDVELVENGGRAVAWATLTGSMLELLRTRATQRLRVLEPAFAATYMLLNGGGALLDRAEERYLRDRPYRLPMNLLLTARRPA
jgi:SAM-dependent methyltransferase